MATKAEKAARLAALQKEKDRLAAEGMSLPPEEAAELAEDEAEASDDAEDEDADKKSASQPSAAEIAEAAGKIATKALADAERAKNPVPGADVQKALENARKPPLAGSEAARARGEETVTMIFPRRVLLTLGDHSRIDFPAGVQEVPASVANHPYLKLSGVKVYVK